MTLHPKSVKPIPALTKEIARQAFPNGNLYMTMRDRLGTFYTDWDFSDLYPQKGQPAASLRAFGIDYGDAVCGRIN